MFFQANGYTSGVTLSFVLDMFQRNWYSYQLTLALLHVLEMQAYDEYCEDGYEPH